VSVLPRGRGRRAVLGSLALAAIGTPLALTQPWASAASKTGGVLWHPDVHRDSLRAFQGIEADRGHKHPERKGRYVVVEQDHWRFNIWRNDRDTTGGGDRQRTEMHGMQAGGHAVNMRDGETWRLAYEMFMPASMHASTYWFNHIFQTKTPKTNDGPWVTLSLQRHGNTEMIQLQADSTSGVPIIAVHELAPLRESWVGVEITLRIGEKGSAALALHSGAGKLLTNGTRNNIRIPDQNGYVWPKWGIYRSVRAAASDIVDTYLLLRNFTGTRLG